MRNLICLDRPLGLLDRIVQFCSRGDARETQISLTTCGVSLEAVQSLALVLRPALLLADEGEMGNLEIGRLLRSLPQRCLQVLVFSDAPSGETIERHLMLGCAGVIANQAPTETLSKAIDSIFRGELWVPRKLLSYLFQQSLALQPSRSLTRRELEILKLICAGATNREIADRLFISRETVRWHLRSLYSKIGAQNREAAVQFAQDLESGSNPHFL